jgi:uncharacterized protein YuzE
VRERKRRPAEPTADRWSRILLEVWYREGCAEYAYLHTPRRLGESRYLHSVTAEPDLILDFNKNGELMGIEMLSPAEVALDAVNRVARKYGLGPVGPSHLRPLSAEVPITGTYHFLEITYREGRPWVGYLYLVPRGQKSARSRRIEPAMVVDIGQSGALLGVELLAPDHITLDDLNRVLAMFGIVPLEKMRFD